MFEMAMVSGSRPAWEEGSMRLSMARSYGTFSSRVERQRSRKTNMFVLTTFLIAGTALSQTPSGSAAKPIKVVVLGDSLSAGLGLSATAAFPARLQQTLEC